MKKTKKTPENFFADQNKKESRQKYQTPCVVEYGYITKLTQGASGTMGDGGAKQA